MCLSLQHPSARRVRIHNSPLSENAAVGFELGYNIRSRGGSSHREAQCGDFINGAQVADRRVHHQRPLGRD